MRFRPTYPYSYITVQLPILYLFIYNIIIPNGLYSNREDQIPAAKDREDRSVLAKDQEIEMLQEEYQSVSTKDHIRGNFTSKWAS